MEANVHRISLHPQRMTQIQWHKHQLAAKHWCQVHSPANVLDHGFVKTAFEIRWQCT